MPVPLAVRTHRFVDSAGYERSMGRWTHAVGLVFLQWLAPPERAKWLDVGCGTGIFTQLILDRCAPSAVCAVDSEQAQIDHANTQPVARRASFQSADAQGLPFADAAFDVVASALVINFIPDPARAAAEMLRVLRRGGVVAGYVWDWAAERSPSWPLRAGLREIGADVPPAPGGPHSTLAALESLFEGAGFSEIVTRSIDVTARFGDFADFWQAQTPRGRPVTQAIAALSDADRGRLTEAVRARLPVPADGTVEYSARANAIKARAPN